MAVFSSRVRLLEVDPDLGRFLSFDELAEARQLAVPAVGFGSEEVGLSHTLSQHGAFAGLLLDGMVLDQLRVGDQVGMRLLGPGDLVSVNDTGPSTLVLQTSARAVAGTHMALLGLEMLAGARRWPGLVRGLHLRSVEQAERLAAQLVVCQLPRVDQRLLALMWLLAESWGRVTPSGTTLPLKLTHDTLGALIGARRPTVTLALRDLSERGGVVRQDGGWLLLEPPPAMTEPPEWLRTPSIIPARSNHRNGQSGPTVPSLEDAQASFRALKARLESLHIRHEIRQNTFQERLTELAVVRERCRETRNRVARDRLSRKRSRSS
ncbi:MAG: Crp/Fnr family transcriptional regulator [Solirubrobacterales bacterium]|nr:Crp/Fnr family transcriptional regulator [Solirubrobacterales bacterium]